MSRSALFLALMVGIVAFSTACSDDGDGKQSGSSSTSTTFTFSGDESEPFCTELEAFSQSYVSVVAPTTTPEQLRTLWADLTVAIAKLEADAPSEIRDSVTVLRARIEGITPAFETAGYVLAAVPQAERDRFQDPAAQDATDELSAYGAQVCEPESDK